MSEYWNNGIVYLVDPTPKKRNRLGELLAANGFDTDHVKVLVSKDEVLISLEDEPGAINEAFRQMNRSLFKEGIVLWGSYVYTGDNDGVVIVKDGKVRSCPREYDMLRTGEDKEIIGELKDRGYDVSSLMAQWEVRHAQGKDKVIP